MATFRMRRVATVGIAALAGACSGTKSPAEEHASSGSASGGSGSSLTTGTATGAMSDTGGGGATDTGGGGQGADPRGGGGGSVGGAEEGGAPPVEAEVFAHSADTLYKLNPNTNEITVVGPFALECNGGIIDIALDKNGNLFASAGNTLSVVDKTNAHCVPISNMGSYPNSLSFVPEGTLLPFEEALVGYAWTTYVRIDTTTGEVFPIGELGISGLHSSGDIVSVIGGGSYLTVTGDGCDTDCLVEVDPTTGQFVQLIGELGYQAVFGIAYWAGLAYGFSAEGYMFEIDVSNAVTTPISIPDPPFGLSFFGAGSTTAAPHR